MRFGIHNLLREKMEEFSDDEENIEVEDTDNEEQEEEEGEEEAEDRTGKWAHNLFTEELPEGKSSMKEEEVRYQ
jgi:hypothetical protein